MRSLQYCCLMIPVKNRELLKVLLKFMVRLLDNHALSLSDDLPTKEKVIKIGGNVLSCKFLSQISLYNNTHESYYKYLLIFYNAYHHTIPLLVQHSGSHGHVFSDITRNPLFFTSSLMF